MSTQTYAIEVVDVFAERPLAGNQLAVVFDAAGMSDAQMQAIALEMNYSETTFVIERSEHRARVRIFTPSHELPFAGHPTIGTAWVLTRGQGGITLDLPIGPVEVRFAEGVGWMTPPVVEFIGQIDAPQAAALVGLDEADLATELPIEIAHVGPKFVLIPLTSLAALKRAKLNTARLDLLAASGVGVLGVFVFTADSYGGDADYAARMFFESAGVREDPATGSANAVFAAYLHKHLGALGDVVVDQGVEIGRPSRLYLKVSDLLQLGGRVQPTIRGELQV